jgi:D-threo-aldose 1-dehydrogenase
MIYNEIRNTGVKIPPIIFGTSALGNLYETLTNETKLEIVSESVKYVGQNVVFDSAGKYGAGLSLEMLGTCLGKLGVKPDDVVISNKLGWKRIPLTTPEPTFEKGVWMNLENDAVQSISYEGIIACWEQGNQLLGPLYAPKLASVHDPDEYLANAKSPAERKKLFQDIRDAYKALSELKAQGKVKAIGVGAKNWKIIREISEHVDLDWAMFANSLTLMTHPDDLLRFMESLHKNGVSIVNSAVFNAGFLIGGDYFDYVKISPDTEENKARFKWREDFFGICRQSGIKPAIACVAFGMTGPGVVSISLNTSNPSHVKSNVESVTSQVPEEFWKAMKDKGLIKKDYPYLGV